MNRRTLRIAAVLSSAGMLGGAFFAQAIASPLRSAPTSQPHHVLLLSVDGMHQSDLEWYVATHPDSALAHLVDAGTQYTQARTTVPSDGLAGMVAQLTGGGPGITGVYADDAWNAALLPAGTTNCKGVRPGAEVDFTDDLDKNKSSLDAGQGLSGLPGSILQMTGAPQKLIDAGKLPVDPSTCKPVFPHSYLLANTVFEVAQNAGLRTAWSDQHAADEILDGPTGTGIDDLFTPEVDSDATGHPAGDNWSSDSKAAEQYDTYKAQAVLNEIDGFNHQRTVRVGTPSIFGMDFQAVSTAQKLPSSEGLSGGYAAKNVPGPLVAENLDFVSDEVGRMVSELRKRHLDKVTTIILSAEHGQSPTDPRALTRVDDRPLLNGLNTAWRKTHPKAGDLVVHSVDDDGMLLWLSDRSKAATDFTESYLLGQSGLGADIDQAPKAFTHSGLDSVYAGAAAAKYFGVRPGDARVPDIVGVAQYGIVYTGGTRTVAEHGGAQPDDLNVPLVISGASTPNRTIDNASVRTEQIAPTILTLLGLDPSALVAVDKEHTEGLPIR